MTKKEKQFIEAAIPIKDSNKTFVFESLYIINSGKAYKGAWGENGYKNIIILGYNSVADRHYNITYNRQSDDLEINNPYGAKIDFEIPANTNCFHIWMSGDYLFQVDTMLSSTIINIVKAE